MKNPIVQLPQQTDMNPEWLAALKHADLLAILSEIAINSFTPSSDSQDWN